MLPQKNCQVSAGGTEKRTTVPPIVLTEIGNQCCQVTISRSTITKKVQRKINAVLFDFLASIDRRL